MQGSFNVEWDKVLDPGLDEETQRLYGDRGGEKRKVRRRVRRIRRAGGDEELEDEADDVYEDEPEPAVEQVPELTNLPPSPATLKFVVEGPVGRGNTRFFVIPGKHRARVGKFGHYLTPTTVTGSGECVPFPPIGEVGEPDLEEHPLIYGGLPGFPQAPAFVNDLVLERASARTDRSSGDFKFRWDDVPPEPDWKGWRHAPLVEIRLALEMDTPDQGDFNIISRREYHKHPTDPKWHGLGDRLDRDPYPFPPNLDVCEVDVHYTFVVGYDYNPKRVHYYEVGRQSLEESVEDGERLDFCFAQRMQGLLGGAQDSVWACLDPGFNPLDRKDALHQFVATYMAGFYGAVSFGAEDGARAVAVEAMQQHRAFCQASSGFVLGGLIV